MRAALQLQAHSPPPHAARPAHQSTHGLATRRPCAPACQVTSQHSSACCMFGPVRRPVLLNRKEIVPSFSTRRPHSAQRTVGVHRRDAPTHTPLPPGHEGRQPWSDTTRYASLAARGRRRGARAALLWRRSVALQGLRVERQAHDVEPVVHKHDVARHGRRQRRHQEARHVAHLGGTRHTGRPRGTPLGRCGCGPERPATPAQWAGPSFSRLIAGQVPSARLGPSSRPASPPPGPSRRTARSSQAALPHGPRPPASPPATFPRPLRANAAFSSCHRPPAWHPLPHTSMAASSFCMGEFSNEYLGRGGEGRGRGR
jgi:hypothetical protein